MTHKLRWIIGTLLVFVASATFADNSVSIASSAVTNHTDISMNYLSQIFGTVGNVLSGTSGQMVGKLFHTFNIGIMVVSAMWLCYTLIHMAHSAAVEGNFASGRHNHVLTMLKIALGMAALFPSPTTGYSVIQDIVMKVVVQGVKLADMTWSSGLDYIKQGGAVWRPPATASDGAGLTAADAKPIYDHAVYPVFTNEVCMYKSMARQSLRASQRSGPASGGIANTGASPAPLNPSDNENSHNFTFPSDSDPSSGCGTISWGGIPGAVSGGQTTTEGQYAYQALRHVVFGVLPAAQEQACSDPTLKGSSFCQSVGSSATVSDDVSENLFTNMLAYINVITPLVNTQAQHAGNSLKEFFTNSNSQGWLMAGRYSWDLMHLQDNAKSSANYGSYLPDSSSKSPTDPTIWNSIQSKFNNYADASSTGASDDKNFSKSTRAAVAAASAASAGIGAATGGIGPAFIALFGPIITDTVHLHNMFTPAHMGHDPMYFLHRVGEVCLSMAGDLWVSLALIVGGIYAVGMFCDNVADLDRPLEGVVNWVKPIMLGIAGTYIAIGGMLTFYVPMYAFLVFMFGVISWFISVIEAMVCAPMIPFGLMHPEGHDFLGPAKQSLMLLLGVFLRPVLMVLGLIFAMILSYVAFRFLNYSFAAFMSDIFSKSPSGGSGGSVLSGFSNFRAHGYDSSLTTITGSIAYNLIATPILTFFYATTVYLLLNQCYSLVYVLPDYVLRWIGGPSQQSNVAQMMGELKSNVGQSASQTGDAVGKGVSGSVGAAAQLGQSAKKIKSHQQGSAADFSSGGKPSAKKKK